MTTSITFENSTITHHEVARRWWSPRSSWPPVAAVEGEGHAHALAVAAADLQAVRAPAGVARVHGNAPLVPALLAAGVALSSCRAGAAAHGSADGPNAARRPEPPPRRRRRRSARPAPSACAR